MSEETSNDRGVPWGWLAFGLFVAGPCWLPGWMWIDAAVFPANNGVLRHGGLLAMVFLQGAALSVAAAWIAWRRRIVVFRYFAALGVFAALWWCWIPLMFWIYPMP